MIILSPSVAILATICKTVRTDKVMNHQAMWCW